MVIIKKWNKPKNCAECPFNECLCWCKITHSSIDRDDATPLDEKCPIIEVNE